MVSAASAMELGLTTQRTDLVKNAKEAGKETDLEDRETGAITQLAMDTPAVVVAIPAATDSFYCMAIIRLYITNMLNERHFTSYL